MNTLADRRITVVPGQMYFWSLPHSEVCMYMKIAGKRMGIMLLENEYDGRKFASAQVYQYSDHTERLEPFSFPITYSEAGIYRDGDGSYYAYLDKDPMDGEIL